MVSKKSDENCRKFRWYRENLLKNEKNYRKLLLNKADFLAMSGYIWNNKKFKPHIAINKFV